VNWAGYVPFYKPPRGGHLLHHNPGPGIARGGGAGVSAGNQGEESGPTQRIRPLNVFYLKSTSTPNKTGGLNMRRNNYREHAAQAQIRIESIREAVMYWFPAGFAFIGWVLHIFPKIALPM
jgi:hypothetical protein